MKSASKPSPAKRGEGRESRTANPGASKQHKHSVVKRGQPVKSPTTIGTWVTR